MGFKIRAKKTDCGILIKSLDDSHTYKASESSCFIAARAIGTH